MEMVADACRTTREVAPNNVMTPVSVYNYFLNLFYLSRVDDTSIKSAKEVRDTTCTPPTDYATTVDGRHHLHYDRGKTGPQRQWRGQLFSYKRTPARKHAHTTTKGQVLRTCWTYGSLTASISRSTRGPWALRVPTQAVSS